LATASRNWALRLFPVRRSPLNWSSTIAAKRLSFSRRSDARIIGARTATGSHSAATDEFDDDVTLIGGIGPALEKKLAALGITSLKQIAEFTAADIERVDAELAFKGRIEREEWVEQAQDLIAGKPPRAKVDQEAADKAKK